MSRPISWDALFDLVGEFAYHLQDDTPSLQSMSLVSRLFRDAAQKVLFRSLKWLDDYTLHLWLLWLCDFADVHGPHALPTIFRHVKDFSFSLEDLRVESRSVIDLITYITPALTALEVVQVSGSDGLLCLHSDRTWFSDFVIATNPTVLCFHATLIPQYILEFSYPSVRIVQFNACRIDYFKTEVSSNFPTEPGANVRLILSQRGYQWDRVEELVSTALNSETLLLVQKAKKLEVFNIRPDFSALRVPIDMELRKNVAQVRRLSIQVPSVYVTGMPQFLQDIIPRAPYIDQIDIFYETGWKEVSTWRHIFSLGLEAMFKAIYGMHIVRLRTLSFRFEDPSSGRNVPQTLEARKYADIYVSAQYDDDFPLYAPPKHFRLAVALPPLQP